MRKARREGCEGNNHDRALVFDLKIFFAIIPNFQFVDREGTLRLRSIVNGRIVWKGQYGCVLVEYGLFEQSLIENFHWNNASVYEYHGCGELVIPRNRIVVPAVNRRSKELGIGMVSRSSA